MEEDNKTLLIEENSKLRAKERELIKQMAHLTDELASRTEMVTMED